MSEEEKYNPQCMENIKWEMDFLATYLSDCNSRKIILFKTSITVMSIIALGIGLLLRDNGNVINITIPLALSVSLVLFAVALINFSIIKELVSIHISRIGVFKQINCLRQAMDSLRYEKYELEYPNNKEELSDKTTNYWKRFGKHRQLSIDNKGLRESEESMLSSPDKFMVFVIASLSAIIFILPIVYMFYAKNTSLVGAVSTILILVFVWFTVQEVKKSSSTITKHLKSSNA